MSTKCRVWWPKELSSSEPSVESSSSSTSLLLFGWFISCSPACVDVVVAFAYDEAYISHHSSESNIEEAICQVNGEMPITLQDKSRLTILGCCALSLENTDRMCKYNMVDGDQTQPFGCADSFSGSNQNSSLGNCGKWRNSLRGSTWIQLKCDAHSHATNEICWVPTLHHLHWNGKMFSEAELHVYARL